MPKTSKPLLPPAGSNRLAKEVGRRLRLARKGRKLSFTDAAAQLGIDRYLYVYLEKGRVLTNDAVYSRIKSWLLEGVTFTGQGAPKTSESQWESKSAWRLLPRSRVPQPIAKRLKATAKRLGLTQAATIHMAIDHFLDNAPAILTLESAMKKIQRARISQALQESPALRDILAGEVGIMVKAGKDLVSAEEKLKRQPSIEQVAQIPLTQFDPTLTEGDRDDWEV